MHGKATFTATLDLKASFPFEPGDLYGVLTSPYGVAVGKTFGLVTEALTRTGLPAQATTIDVAYHGADVIVAKGSDSVFVLVAEIPKVYVDLASCTGLEGPYVGVGGYEGAKTTAGFQMTGALFKIPVPEETPGGENRISVTADVGRDPAAQFLIMKGDGGKQFLDGEIRLFPEMYSSTAAVVLEDWRVGRPVGEIEILIAGSSFPFADLTFPIARVTSDPRCADVEYVYDS